MEDYNQIGRGLGVLVGRFMDRFETAVSGANEAIYRIKYKMAKSFERSFIENENQKAYRIKVETVFREYVDNLNEITPYEAIREEELRRVKMLKNDEFDSFDSLDKVLSQGDASKAAQLKQLDENLIKKLRQLRKDYQESFPSSRAQFVIDTDRIILDYIFDKRGNYRSKEDQYYFSISNKFSFINTLQLVESCRSPIEVAHTFRPRIVWFGVDKNFLQFYEKYKDEKFVDALFSQFEKAYREQGGTYFDGDISAAANIDLSRFRAAFAQGFEDMLDPAQFRFDEEMDAANGGNAERAFGIIVGNQLNSSRRICNSWQKLMFYSVIEKLHPEFDTFLNLLENFYNSREGNQENRKIDNFDILTQVPQLLDFKGEEQDAGRRQIFSRLNLYQYLTRDVFDKLAKNLFEKYCDNLNSDEEEKVSNEILVTNFIQKFFSKYNPDFERNKANPQYQEMAVSLMEFFKDNYQVDFDEKFLRELQFSPLLTDRMRELRPDGAMVVRPSGSPRVEVHERLLIKKSLELEVSPVD